MISRLITGIAVLVAFVPKLSDAQEFTSNRQAFYFGIKGAAQIHGIANQNNYGQKEMDYSIPIGFAGGIMVQYKLNERSYLLAEVNYQQQGQTYKDNFNNKSFKKRVDLNYLTIPVMFKYMISERSTGYQGVNVGKPKWFASGGLQIGKLSKADIEWEINGALTNFMTFVTDGGNPNQIFLEENGTPANDADFFQDIDLSLVVAIGFHSYLNSVVTASVELRGSFGLTDINAEEWRLNNRFGEYGASHTTFFGLHAGLAFKIFEQK